MNQPKVGRNDPCPCGSGKKYKNCHYGKENIKTYTATGKRKFKAKVLSSSDKSTAVFYNAPPIPSISDAENLKIKLAEHDYRLKTEGSSFSFTQHAEPVPEAKPFEPLQIPEGEFTATQENFENEKKNQE